MNGLPLGGTAKDDARVVLGFLPLGTGNSFLRDFGKGDEAHALQALREGRRLAVDVVRLVPPRRGAALDQPAVPRIPGRRRDGDQPAVQAVRCGGLLRGGAGCCGRSPRPRLPARDRRRHARRGALTLLSFSNSRFTGGGCASRRTPIRADGDARA